MIQITGFLRSVASFIDDIPGVYQPQDDFETTISNLGMDTVLISASVLFVLTIIAVLFANKYEKIKLPLFILMSIAMAGSSLVLVVSTVVLNTRSDSGGPVHWHADIEFWACGNELELRDPTGFLSNKIGTATLHEHDDHRIHLEGVVVEEEIDASLGKFMSVTGGAITDNNLVVPLNADGEGMIFEDEEDGDGPSTVDPDAITPYIVDDADLGKVARFQDGDTCNEQVSDVQVFVYQINEDGDTYTQTKLDNPRDYVIADDSNVPPGDCVIFEFGPTRDKTDKLCEQYGIRDVERCSQFGVAENQRAICELTQTDFSSDDANPENATGNSTQVNETEESTEVIEGPDEDELEPVEGAVHIDPTTESARLACEAEGGGEGPACTEYNNLLKDNPGAQAEAEAQTQQTEGGN